VITAYHSGAGNVRKAKSGVEALGINGQEYAGKVSSAEVPPVQMASMSDTDGYNFYPKDLTSMYPKASNYSTKVAPDGVDELGIPLPNTAVVPKSNWYDSTVDYITGMPKASLDLITSTPNAVKDTLQASENLQKDMMTFDWWNDTIRSLKEIPGDLSDSVGDAYTGLAKGKILESTITQENYLKDSVKDHEYYKKQYEEKKKNGNLTQTDVDRYEESKKDLEQSKKSLKILTDVNEKIALKEKEAKEKLNKEIVKPKEENKIKVAEKVIQETNTADYGEGKSELDKADDEWAKKNLTGEFEGDFAQNLINKAKEYGGVVVDKSIEFFKGAFSSMFDGEELARMAMIYAGSRVMGYDHGGSLNYSMKNYMKRVNANSAYAKKAVLDKDFADRFTASSLAKYAKSADVNDLIPAAKQAGGITGTSGSFFDEVTGSQVQAYTVGTGDNKRVIVDVNGTPFDLASAKNRKRFKVYNEDIHDSTKVTGDFQKSFDNQMAEINRGIDTEDGGVKLDISSDELSLQAYNLYTKDRDRFRMSEKDSQQLKYRIVQAQRDYLNAENAHNINKDKNRKPTSLEGFYNKRTIQLRTKGMITYNDVKNTDPDNLDLVEQTLMEAAVNAAGGNPMEAGNEYRKLWEEAKDTWKNMKSYGSFEANKTPGYDPFILWVREISLLDPTERAKKLELPSNMKK
jgi:hypothetical protein